MPPSPTALHPAKRRVPTFALLGTLLAASLIVAAASLIAAAVLSLTAVAAVECRLLHQ